MMQQNEVYYPWQQQQWRHLTALRVKAQIPHALLLVGSKGLGKLHFAQGFAKTLLCSEATATGYCNQCRHCHLYDVANHPDLTLLSATEDALTIKIDDIRQLIVTANQTPQQAKYKVVIIEPVEAMNIAAANAILKILEEPPGHTVFLLVCHYLHQVPATIRSRCQALKFDAPSLEDSGLWLNQKGISNSELYLKLANASPLMALEYLKTNYLSQRDALLDDLASLIKETASLVATVNNWIKQDVLQLCNILLSFIIDIIRLKSRLNLRYITHQDKATVLNELTTKLQLPVLYSLLDKLYAMQHCLRSKANINQQLLLEDFAISLLDAGYKETDGK